MKAKNRVIGGDFIGRNVISVFGIVSVGKIELNHLTVESYETISQDTVKSAKSGIARGIVGGALLGPVGALAGVISAKNKSIYHIAIKLKSGENMLLEIDNKIYTALLRAIY